ncbi:abc transporter [Phlyctochytrium arcticum]|nr:abc transporter [Phlyctochytrium arcticum]
MAPVQDHSADWRSKAPQIHKELGEPVVIIKHLSKTYSIPGTSESVKALHDIHLSEDSEFYPIRRGEFVILRGPSGGGKTTLLNILGTIDNATSGTVEILGEEISEISSDTYLSDLRLRRIGFVFQTFNLLATMSAFENVELPMTIRGKMSRLQIKAKAMQLLETVGLQDRVAHLPSELSGGEQQRVTIARALSNDPDILLLDEPTGDLDTANTIDIMNLLLGINREKKTTCIMVTHNPDVECYADRLLYLEDGHFVKQAINKIQTPLILEDYQEYLRKKDE